MEWTDTMDLATGKFKDKAELVQLLHRKGLMPSQPIVTYCQHAIRAAHSAFVLEHLLGYRQVRLYEASMQEFLNQSKIR